MSNDAAGFPRVTDRSVASPNGALDAGLRPDPFPDRAASLLPGLLAATRTGLTPAGNDELMLDRGIRQLPPGAGPPPVTAVNSLAVSVPGVGSRRREPPRRRCLGQLVCT